MPENFNFSKIEDQKKFENLPEKEREEIVGVAQWEAQKDFVFTREQQVAREKIAEQVDKFITTTDGKMGVTPGMFIKVIDEIKKINEQYALPQEIIENIAVGEIIKSSKNLNCHYFIKFAEEFSALAPHSLLRDEVKQAAKERMIEFLDWGNDYSVRIKNYFEVSSEDPLVQKSVKDALNKFLCRTNTHGINGMEYAVNLKDNFHLPLDVIHEVASLGFAKGLADREIDFANSIKSEFNLPEEIVQQNVKQIVLEKLAQGDLYYFFELKKQFNFLEQFSHSSEFQQVAEKGFINKLQMELFADAIAIKKALNLSEGFTQSAEVQLAVKEMMIKFLSKGKINYAIEIKNELDVDVSSLELYSRLPYLRAIVGRIDSLAPGFASQAGRSVEICFSLCEFMDSPEFIKEIQENPFLLDAVLENPRFSSKLLIKYPKFDKFSKENIRFLFDTKKEILAANPDMEPEFLEFRQLMQGKLKNYKDNPEILEAIEKFGINVEEWLNYSETKYFNLESGESHLAFSETISTPINRIKETIDSYAHILKSVLKEYKTELTEFKIPLEDTKEIEEKISQMQSELEKAKIEGNEKKVQGIEKGIESLKNKIENIKTVGLWDKLLGDTSAFQQLKNDVFQAQGNLIEAENDLQEKISGKIPSGRMIQNLKEKISKVKEELRSKFGILETRIENFKTALPELIAPCLNKERSEALIQEIEQNLAEQFDHYNTDRNTLSNLFSERGDEKKDKLESQPMSIFVWARNPDIDLYQGNYTNCCIRIDSEHMGAESTIADYNTDLGVQIVNIWNETKNEPAVAAWCWLGKNENNEAVLVVDNIESNTLYSANYPEQLTKELFDYLREYAESIGAKKIVMGKANNDLPTAGELAKFKDDTQKYEKIGGSNRPDGYFLEAENKSVKIVWEVKEKEGSKKAEKKGKEVVKIQFENLSISNLSENDFAKIKQLERKIYQGTDLILGQAMIEDIKQGNGFEYSIIIDGQKSAVANKEAVGYLAAVEDETDEGDHCVYLEDIAVIPEAQGQEIGWRMLQNLIGKLKEKAQKENKPVLLDMHLREGSQRFMEKYGQQLEQMGVKLLEEALVPDYYDESEDALYKVYEVKN